MGHTDPPIYDVCFHKMQGSWFSSGRVLMQVEFDGESDQLYEFEWHGYMEVFDREARQFVNAYHTVSQKGRSGYFSTPEFDNFWWRSLSARDSYGLTIYEGEWDWENLDDRGFPTWVRGDHVASVSFYANQEAASVYLSDSSLFPGFPLSTYYCTIDWDWELPASDRHHGAWEYYWYGPNSRGAYRYGGDPGSPRFHYPLSSYPYSVYAGQPPRTSGNTLPWPSWLSR